MRLTSLLLVGIMFLSACGDSSENGSSDEQGVSKLDSLETVVFADNGAKASPKASMMLIREYAKYYKSNKTDSLGKDRLFKAGEISLGIGQGNLALKYFKILATDHADFHKAPEALFLCGFTSETLNTDTSEARFYYEKFIKTYPEHKLAQDAQFSILNLGKSDEELIEMFEKNLEAKDN